jgi:ketosteroid isomerase-like protein
MKNQLYILGVILFLGNQAIAQSLPASVQAVVDAENSFAGRSKEKSTKAAFLANLDERGIVFSQGSPVNGQDQWAKLPENDALLFWWPVFADAASSGDFGYTTGPFEVSLDRKNPVPSGFGYYSTVWKKNAKGEWKVAIDMGIGFPKKEEIIPSLKTSHNPLKGSGTINTVLAKEDLLSVDKAYLAAINTSGKSFDLKKLSAEARVHRTGSWPNVTPEAIRAIDESDKKFQFEHLNGDVAHSGDLGYCYGKVKVTVTREGNTRDINLNYLRIWKKEAGEWKIVLDVIGG